MEQLKISSVVQSNWIDESFPVDRTDTRFQTLISQTKNKKFILRSFESFGSGELEDWRLLKTSSPHCYDPKGKNATVMGGYSWHTDI